MTDASVRHAPLDWRRVPLAGRQLVEASAGTGKTYTITTLFVRALLELELGVKDLLVVTFTNAATAELRDRVRGRLAEAVAALETGTAPGDPALAALLRERRDPEADRRRLLEARSSMDEAAIYTIHGFCQRVLQEHAFESGVRFDLDLATDARPLLQEIVEDFWAQVTYAASEVRVRFLARHAPLPALLKIARVAASAPDLPIVPAPRAADPDVAVERYFAERDALRAAWPAARAEVAALLASPALSRRSYSLDAIPAWVLAMDALVGDERRTLATFEKLDRFTPAVLEGATRKGQRTPQHPFFTLCQRLLAAQSSAEAELLQWLVALKHQLVDFTRRELQRRKSERGIQTFDDLVHELARAVRGEDGRVLADRIFARHPCALIDEFQDTDPDQYGIFDAIYAHASGAPRGALFLIGDPKQAIYAFRGADVFAYLRAVAGAVGPTWTLDVSYRTDPALLAGLNQVFSRPVRPFALDAIAYRAVGTPPGASERLLVPATAAGEAWRPPLCLLFVRREERTGRRDDVILKRGATEVVHAIVAQEIVALLSGAGRLEGRRIEPGHIAVLTRTNREAATLQSELIDRGVPAVLQGDASVFDAEEAVDVARVLLALAEPGNARAVRGALATRVLGLDGNELERLSSDEEAWEAWVERFSGWHSLWVQRGFVQAFRALLRDQSVVGRLLGERRGERRLTNVLHLVELLHQAATTQHLGIAGLIRWFDEVRHDTTARDALAAESAQVRLESDARAVQLTTMHKSKGLEYPIVFCPFLWDGKLLRDESLLTYHDPAADHRLTLDLAPGLETSVAREHAGREALAEALRLAYVAMTRAKHRLVVVCGQLRSYGTSPLAHLLHDPAFVPGLAAHSPAERVKLASDDDLVADLRQLATAASPAVEVVEVATVPTARYAPPLEAPPRLAARVARRALDRRWRAASFSALASSATELSAPAEEGRDRDEEEGDLAVSGGGATAPASVAACVLAEFPRGAVAGNVLHAVLETVDFTAADAPTLREHARRQLERFGLPVTFAEVLATAVQDVLATPLAPDTGLCLARIERAARVSEMEFTLPVVTDGAIRRLALTPKRLAAVFARHASAAVPRSYAGRVAALRFDALAGYLRGFIDLVFTFEGRYYVVDYKSNYLGSTHDDYAPEHLAEAMVDHHYVLQYHLYAAALHRHLGLRVSGYDFERVFGGVFYLFARGMSPALGPARGVFADRPTLACLTALLGVLDGRDVDDA